MKTNLFRIAAGLALGAIAAWSGVRAADDAPKPAPAAAGKTADASNPLHLDAAKRKAAGITVATARKIDLRPEVEAFGRVLDPTPYVSLVAEIATARASLEASEKELARVKKLYAAGGNASAQAVETAESAADKDRAAVASAEVRLLAGWGRPLTEHADLGLIRDTLAQGAALIRIDLLPGDHPAASLSEARVTLLGGDEAFNVQVLGPAPIADPQVQGASFLALLRGHSLPAGATLRVTLPGQGEPQSALVLPRTAIVYHQGSAWVYELEKDTFERKLVTLGRDVGDDVVVAKGIDDDDQIAVTGAGQLLSAELSSGGAPDED